MAGLVEPGHEAASGPPGLAEAHSFRPLLGREGDRCMGGAKSMRLQPLLGLWSLAHAWLQG